MTRMIWEQKVRDLMYRADWITSELLDPYWNECLTSFQTVKRLETLMGVKL